MCGIVAVKDECTICDVIDGLKRLEYRGYDSCGIGYKAGGKIECIKSVGCPDNLRKMVDNDTAIKIAIGHNRWATHGKVTIDNSHPHFSGDGNFAIVHNGILENHADLKAGILRGVTFKSDTDSEVIAHLLSKNFNGNVWDSFKATIRMLKGSFAIVMINMYDDCVYFARCKSPLVIGKSATGFSIASDVSGLVHAESIAYVNDENIGYIDRKANIYDKNFKKCRVNYCKSSESNDICGKGEYSHYMIKEICEIPSRLQAIDAWISSHNLRLPKCIDSVKIIACGTSYHSGLVGKKYIEKIAGIPTECEIASEYIYNHHIVSPNTLGIFISQSGETAETINALNRARSEGMYTLAISNVMESSITVLADESIYTCAGSEICVASTKAYTNQVFALLKLSNIIRNVNLGNYTSTSETGASDLVTAEPRLTQDYLGISDDEYNKLFNVDISKIMCDVDGVVDILKGQNEILLIGRDYDFITVKEGALKIKEVTYTFTDAYPCGELKHGTLALIDENSVVLALCTDVGLAGKVSNAVHEIVSRGGKVVGFGSCVSLHECVGAIRLGEYHSLLMPMVAIIPFDILAYKLAIAKGLDPDKPRNLAKSVTVE